MGFTRTSLRVAAALVMALMTVGTSRAAQNVAPVTQHGGAAIAGRPTNASMLGLACPGSSGCFAAGRSVATPVGMMAQTHNGGTTSGAAGSAAGAAGSQTLLTISCPSVTVCYAGGDNGTVLATRDGGATWHAQTSGTNDPVVSIACPAIGGCFALVRSMCEELGAHVPLLHTTDGGSIWARASIPGCGSSIACPGMTTCYADVSPTGPGYPEFVRTTDSGKSWQERARINPNRLQEGLACPTPTVCYVAFLDAVGRSTNAGKGWTISHIGTRQCRALAACPHLEAIACPGGTICYAGGTLYQHNGFIAGAVTTKDGFRSRTSHPIQGLHGITALSCPTQSVCFALGGFSGPQTGGWVTAGDAGRFAATTNAGTSWHVGRITTPYPFNALACPSVGVCYAGGFLGRLMGTRDGGATWHDLIPAIFVSGTYGARQPLHTYSEWFTATQPWQVAAGQLPGPLGAGGRPIPATACKATATVAVYVRNSQDQIVAGPIRVPHREAIGGTVGRRTVQVTGKLRLDVVSHCSSFSVRVDGVEGFRMPSR